MLWDELCNVAADQMGEPISKDDYYKKYQMKLYASGVQNEVSGELRCLEVNESAAITTVIGTAAYTLPVDCELVRLVRYGTTSFIRQCVMFPEVATVPSGTPYLYRITNQQIIVYPTPSAVSAIYLWYYKKSPAYAFRLVYTPQAAATACTIAKSATAMTLIITGGTHAGTYPIDITAAAYDTLTELVARINAYFPDCAATACSDAVGTTLCTTLETFTAMDIFTAKYRDQNYFFNPELPNTMHRALLLNPMMEHLSRKNKNQNMANGYYQAWNMEVKNQRRKWMARTMSERNALINEMNNQNAGSAFDIFRNPLVGTVTDY